MNLQKACPDVMEGRFALRIKSRNEDSRIFNSEHSQLILTHVIKSLHILKPALGYIAIVIWFLSTVLLAWIPSQEDFYIILLCLIGGFGAYAILLQTNIEIKWVIAIAVVARIIVVPSFPNLSDDIFRFIWDGRLIHLGINPLAHLPVDIVAESSSLTQDLLQQLNSPNYYSIYPPVPQFIFWLSSFVTTENYGLETLIMKSIHLVFELGALRLIWLLLAQYDLPRKYWLLYALNPLIIIETLANVHHEGIMMFFVLACLYFINRKHILIAGSMMALAICTKVLPLLLCPFIFFFLRGRQRWMFTFMTLGLCLILILPFVISSDLLSNLSESAGLYMSKFEFNGSIYYLLRAWGHTMYGYNLIHVLGPTLKIIAALGIIGIALRLAPKAKFGDLPLLLLLSYCIYTFLSVTIHPWYIVTVITLTVFTKFRFGIIWSGLIMLTYINYSYNPYHENLWVVFVEYTIVFALIFKEMRHYGKDFKIDPSGIKLRSKKH